MSFETFIGRRYLRAKQKQAFISLITILSVAGVAVGVMALIVVIAVMTGFEADLKSRILGGQPQVMIMRHGGPFTNYRQILREVEKTPGVEAATPFIYAQIMLRSKHSASGAVLRGIDPDSAGRVMKTLQHLNLSPATGENSAPGSSPDIPGIVLGRELAKNLGVIEGDVIVKDGRILRVTPIEFDEEDAPSWTIEARGQKFTPPRRTTLAAHGILREEEARWLRDTYLFFRRVETRLQIALGLDTKEVPADEAAQRVLALRLGYADTVEGNAAHLFLTDLEEATLATRRRWQQHLG